MPGGKCNDLQAEIFEVRKNALTMNSSFVLIAPIDRHDSWSQ